MDSYQQFVLRLKLLISKNPNLITTTLSNIFTMRLVGNKTHGDLAEIAISEFINQYMYDFKSIHVGKDLFRSKQQEEDIKIINEITKDEFPVSLKAYGDGPLQLSTDKNFLLFPKLQTFGKVIEKEALIELWKDSVFCEFNSANVLPLIYDEKKLLCNILVFDYERARKAAAKIVYEEEGESGKKRRKHPVYRFYDDKGGYICEIRYGDGTSNALQRGLWTHTKRGLKYFNSVTDGWISYSHSKTLVSLFAHALISSGNGHQDALKILKKDIEQQKRNSIL